ncbi:MAG: HD domain-containing protein [Candidatus Berkelbacteria bacterium]|nr:HD domain-containing protein [Candidatus Berkelbacteria bacterium]
MTKDIIEKIEQVVKNECKKKTNFFGYTAWSHHIKNVEKNAQNLAKILKADYEICTLSALFHDFASVHKSNQYENHHIESGKLAEEILNRYNYPPQKIKQIKNASMNTALQKESKRPA